MIYLAIGRRKRGKTTLAYYLARKLPQRVIFDPRQQIGLSTVRVSASHQIQDALDAMHADARITELVVTPRGDVNACFDTLCAHVQTWIETDPARPLALLVDEARFVDTTRRNAAFDWVLRCAPYETVHVILTCHRPKDVSPDVRGVMDHWLLFRCTQEHDLAIIDEKCGADIARAVSVLEPYQWIQWDDGEGLAHRHLDPRVWYTPLRSMQGDNVSVGTFADLSGTPFDRPKLF